MTIGLNQSNQRWAYLVLAIILFSYLACRAALVPFVHDEAASFFFYIQSGSFWFYTSHWDANNHVLNSLLEWLSYSAFGDSPFFLRLPNLLSFLVYLWFTWKTGQQFLSGYRRHIFILSMWCCHIYFEHFGYARGYGMSFAFLSAALYYLIDFASSNKWKRLVGTLVFISLAMFANLTLLPLGTIMVFWLGLLLIIAWKASALKTKLIALPAISLAVCAIAYFAVFSFELKARDLLYYGGKEGVIADTLQSIAMGLFRIDNWWAGMALFGLILIAVLPLAFQTFRFGIVATLQSAYGIFAGLLLAILISILAMNVVLGVNFPTFRTALYFIPLLFGALAFWPTNKYKVEPYYFLPVLVVLFLFQTNLSYAWYWKWERITPEMYQTAKAKLPEQQFPALTGGYHLHSLRWALYGFDDNYKMGHWSRDNYPSLIPDVQVIFKQDATQKWLNYYTKLQEDEFSDQALYIRNAPCDRIKSIHHQIEPQDLSAEIEYVDLLTLNEPKHCAYMIGVNIELKAATAHQELFLVLGSSDSSGNSIGYQAMPVHWHYKDLQDASISASIFLTQPEIPVVQLKAYLWNLAKEPFKIKSAEIQLFELYPEGIPDSLITKTE